MSPQFREYYKISTQQFKDYAVKGKPNTLIFNKHSDLDKFCNYLLQVSPQQKHFKYEWILLKG